MRENYRTALRVLVCGASLWSLELGSYTLPITFGAAVLVGTMAAVLAGYELAIRDARPRIFVAAAVVLFASVLGGYFVWHAHQPPPPTGPLRPGHEPTPKLSCPVKPDPGDLVIAFGTDARIGVGTGPFAAFKVGDCSMLSFTRTARGLSFSDVGYDYDGDGAFMIRDGNYRALLPLALRVLRPDPNLYPARSLRPGSDLYPLSQSQCGQGARPFH